MSTLPGKFIAACAAVALLATGCAPEALAPEVEAVPEAPAVVAVEAEAPKPAVEPASHDVTPVPPEPEPTDEPAPEPAPVVTSASPAPPPPPVALLEHGDEGDGVRDLQHRLLQLQWFEGRITGVYGDDTRLAVEGFQTKRNLVATGTVDRATLDALHGMTREPSHDELTNVLKPGPALMASGSTGDGVKDLQARLKQIAWFGELIDGSYGPSTVDAVEGFQAKRGIPVTGEVDQRTKDRLYAMTRRPTTDELNNVVAEPAPKPSGMTLDDRCLTGRVVCISKTERKLAWVVDGEIRMQMDVRFGSELTPTREGVFAVNWKSRDHHSTIYDSPMPFALFFSGGQAVHYSADFAARGYNGSSHGCVNVRDRDAVAALFDAAREGDRVVVYW